MSKQQTKDMSTLMEVAKLLGQIGTAGAAMYVGAGAARETYDALKAKCREMMDKLDDAQRQLDDIDPRELDNEMRSEPDDETEEKGMMDDMLLAVENALARVLNARDISDLRELVRMVEDAGGRVPSAITDMIEYPADGGVSGEGHSFGTRVDVNLSVARDQLYRYLQQIQANEQRSDPRALNVKAAGAHTLYR